MAETHDFEPVNGLPEAPPRDEQILWQGQPDALALARESLNLTWVAGYFSALAAWRFLTAIDIVPPQMAVAATAPLVVIGLGSCALLYVIALVMARATVYTITDRRVAMRIGAALTVTLNMPFSRIQDIDMIRRRNGTGTLTLDASGAMPLSYLTLWPHARPWHFRKPRPALRCVPNVDHVAGILAEAAQARIDAPVIAGSPTAIAAE